MNMNSDARQLEQITKRIEEFLSRHVRRLADVVDRCSEILAREEAARQLMDDLQQQKNQWERQRQAEALQIEQEPNLGVMVSRGFEVPLTKALALLVAARHETRSVARPGRRGK